VNVRWIIVNSSAPLGRETPMLSFGAPDRRRRRPIRGSATSRPNGFFPYLPKTRSEPVSKTIYLGRFAVAKLA
jgi:hypothetical protein